MSWFLLLPRGTTGGGGVVELPPGFSVLPGADPVFAAPPTPLVYWGTPDPFTGWTSQQGASHTTGQSDPWGGTNAALVSGAGQANAFSGAWGASRNHEGVLCLWVTQGTGTSQVSTFSVIDVTGSVTRASISVQWTGSNISGYSSSVGTAMAPLAVGGNWWLLRIVTSGFISTNSHRTYVFPGGNAIVVAARPTVLLGTLDDARPWGQPRDGYSTVRAPSGVEDAWSYGTDYYLAGTVRHVPAFDTDTPQPVSGWFNGNGEHPTFGWGIARMLQDGLDKSQLTVCPHRAFATTRSYAAYLAGPEDGAGSLETNGLLAYGITFRTTAGHWLGVVP